MEATNFVENTQNTETKEYKNNRVAKLAAAAVLGVALGAGTQAVASNLKPEEPVLPEQDANVTADETTGQAEPQVVEHHHVETVVVHDMPNIVVVQTPASSTGTPEIAGGNVPGNGPGGGGGQTPDVEFHEYGTVDLGNGVIADVVSFTMNGMNGLVLDVDRDGMADGILLDRNGDGNWQPEELSVLEPEDRFSMTELKAEIDNKNIDDLPDYTKSADVDDTLVVEEEKDAGDEDVDIVEDDSDNDQIAEAAVADEDVVTEDAVVAADEEIAVAEEIPAEAIEEAPMETVDNFCANNYDGIQANDDAIQQPMEDSMTTSALTDGTEGAEIEMV